MSEPIADLLGVLSHVLLAALLTFAALSKVLGVGDLRNTLERLGVWAAIAQPAAVGVITAELVAAVGLMTSPARAWPRVLVAVLSVAFAVAGIRALRLDQEIPCNCFGNVRRDVLGWRQVRMLALWVPLLVLAQWRPPDWDLRQGLLGFAALTIGLAGCQLPTQLRLWRTLRGDRMAIDEGWQAVPSTASPEGVASH